MGSEPTAVTHFDSPATLRAWLEAHHASQDELWVGYWKKATGRPSITWEESVDEAICFGWIDGIRRRVDDEAYTIRFTPRRTGSVWSQRNLDRYRHLEEEGRVAAAGRQAFEAGTPAEEPREASTKEAAPALPKDYLARLKASDAAWADWQARPPGYRRQVAGWIMSAKRESTRERRLEALIQDSAAGRKIKPLRI